MAKQHKIYTVWRKQDGAWRISDVFQFQSSAQGWLKALQLIAPEACITCVELEPPAA